MKKHILYSFRRCPFAIRARWAIKMCELEVELREIDLNNKHPEFIKHSLSNTVPLLILDNGEIIEESLDIILWALKASKKNYLDKYYKKISQKKILEFIKENDEIFKYHLDRFKYSFRFDENKKEFHYFEAYRFIKKLNNELNKSTNDKWLIGDQESIADWCLWPFVRQFKIACDHQKISNYFEKPLELWFNYFANHRNYKYVMHKYNLWGNSSNIEIFPKQLDFR
tara:strand:- start:1836 stop:2513 length:678 start_codon:yes stop_codon:yes gene_type:complete